MKTIFISYRRAETEYAAGALCRELRSHFGNQLVFRDKEDIDGGISWKEKIQEEIDKDAALLVMIGKDWANIKDSEGKRRLDKVDDPMRIEIADGLREHSAVIPVLLENAEMPNASELPEEIRPLADINALKLRDGDWQNDIAAVVRTLQHLGFKSQSSNASDLMKATPKPGRARWMLLASYGICVVTLLMFDEKHDADTSIGFMVFGLVALALAIAAHREYGQRKLHRGASAGAIVFSVLVSLAYFGLMTGSHSRSLPDLSSGIWTLRNATDSEGKSFENSVLRFTSQEETSEGLNLHGTFTWRLDNNVVGSEEVTGRYIEKTHQIFLEGNAISPPSSSLTTGSYSAVVSSDGREILEGRWGSTAQNAPGTPGRWEAFR